MSTPQKPTLSDFNSFTNVKFLEWLKREFELLQGPRGDGFYFINIGTHNLNRLGGMAADYCNTQALPRFANILEPAAKEQLFDACS